ncbi:MAG: hypothetical protein MSB12_01090 [Lentisphaeraceae bacterium]|nr:hypothetical protein [Lentisphaeraceae bacterium]
MRQRDGIAPSLTLRTCPLSTILCRLSPYWRSTLIVFLAMRLGDAVNAITGLWAIPRALGAERLGAVLPLLQFGAVLTLPMTVLCTVFTRTLCAYIVAGEQTKARGLLRDTLLLALLCLALGLGALACGIVPPLCRCLNIPVSPATATLALVSALLAALVPMTTAALQATKRFGAMALGSLLAAPLRLAAMLLCLPLLGLSGYFLGQSLPLLLTAAIALLALRPLLQRAPGVPLPFGLWLADLRPLARYTLWVALGALVAALQGAAVTFAIRHRLAADASAAYYLLSRFAELATYCGTTLALVLFPYAVEARAHQQASAPLLRRTALLLFAGGLLLSAALFFALPPLFRLLPTYAPYASYAPWGAYLALTTTLNALSTLHFSHAMARNDFRWLAIAAPIALAAAALFLLSPTLSLPGALHRLFALAALQLLATLALRN